MKNLITLLFVLFTVTTFSQDFQWKNIDSVKSRNYRWFLENKELVELEFVRLIDSARQANVENVIYDEYYYTEGFPTLDKYTVLNGTYPTNKELKESYKSEKNKSETIKSTLVKSEGYLMYHSVKTRKVKHIVYDSVMTLAAEHHVKYGFNVMGSKFYLNHSEGDDIYTDVTYDSDLPILRHPEDRVDYYCTNRYYKGECLTDDPTNDANITKGKFLYQKSPKEEAYKYFIGFKESPKHWEIFMKKGDVNFMGIFYGMDETSNQVFFNTIIGNEKKTKES